MPPKTRANRNAKASKENIGTSYKTKAKATGKVSKLPRKVLADKTNSASDDNATILNSKPIKNTSDEINLLIKQRPRRQRRLPNRYVENIGVENLTNINITIEDKKKLNSPSISKIPVVVISPLKTPKTNFDCSLSAMRPKRICRLPSKFDDHSISPSKFIPVQPAYASTPKVTNKNKEIQKKSSERKTPKTGLTIAKVISTRAKTKKPVIKKLSNTSKTNSPNSSADTNNNAKTDLLPHNKTKNIQDLSKVTLPNTQKIVSKKPVNKNDSLRILEDRKKSLKRDANNVDVYEFTYDPNEEPPPQKKKRKKPVKKREPKPKTVVFKDNYDRNLAKVLRHLKNTISDKVNKPDQPPPRADEFQKVNTEGTEILTEHPATETVVSTNSTKPIPSHPCIIDKSSNSIKNYNSVRVEDIALDFEQESFVDNVNYSPAHTFHHPTMPAHNDVPDLQSLNVDSIKAPTHQNNISNLPKAVSNDPLNLREELSFFDDQPVASSSMNMSIRNPAASPWRVEFGSLPIKWQVNTYVKPNMTPAFDSSFMNFNESNKKHVYTNMVMDTNENQNTPQIYEDYASKLKQTSIISFIKEVVENKAKKKKAKLTPIKASSLFEEVTNTINDALLAQNDHQTPQKNDQTAVESNDQRTPSNVSNVSHENVSDNSKENEKESSRDSSKSTSKKKRNKNLTYFGFDDSENIDQENVSPVKKIDKRKLRALKPRSRAVLQEINNQKGPSRAILPVAIKSKPTQGSEVANDLFDQMKSATEPPVFPDKDPIQIMEATNSTEVQNNEDLNDDESVHLFEDLELVHHIKAHRKSYGKAKKAVTCRQNSVSDSDINPSDVAEQSASSDDDNSLDLTFKVPEIQPKKKIRKKKTKQTKKSKKEEQEVEEWAAGFNSMCEDIEEFDLVVE